VVVPERLATDAAGVRFEAAVGAVVHLELFGTSKALAALLAYVRLFAGMRPHVDDELAALDKSLVALGALVRPFARVNPHVPMQFPAVLERPSTHIALVGPFFGVNTAMHTEILLDGEGLVAEFALVRFLARVCSVVPREARRHRERFAADLALVGVLALAHVGAHVVLQGRLLRERLVAHGAVEGRRAGGRVHHGLVDGGRRQREDGQVRAAHDAPHARVVGGAGLGARARHARRHGGRHGGCGRRPQRAQSAVGAHGQQVAVLAVGTQRRHVPIEVAHHF